MTYLVVAIVPLVVGAVTESEGLAVVGSILAMFGSTVICLFVCL